MSEEKDEVDFVEDVSIKFPNAFYSTDNKEAKQYLQEEIGHEKRHPYWLNWEDVRKMLLEARKQAYKEIEDKIQEVKREKANIHYCNGLS